MINRKTKHLKRNAVLYGQLNGNPYRSAANLEYARLFYGICLGRLSRELLRLPGGTVDAYGNIDLEKLKGLAARKDLQIFSTQELSLTTTVEPVHLGMEIGPDKEVLGQRETTYECHSFALRQILDIHEDPSDLISRLQEIGILAVASDFRLYAMCGVD